MVNVTTYGLKIEGTEKYYILKKGVGHTNYNFLNYKPIDSVKKAEVKDLYFLNKKRELKYDDNIIEKELVIIDFGNYFDVYEHSFNLEYFASVTKLKNINTGNQVLLISNMVFSELVKTAGLSEDEWYKNLVLKSFRTIKALPASKDTDLAYLLDKYIRDREREYQAKDAVESASIVNEDDLTIQYFKEVSRNFKLKETFNKKNKVYYYDLLIEETRTSFEESIVQDDFLVMIDDKRILYLDIKRKSFKGYFINENGQKQRLKFKRKKTGNN